MTLVGLYSDLLDRRKSELKSESGYNFTKNMVKSTSILVSLVIGWNEIHNETLRYKSSSNILSFVLGSMLLNLKNSKSIVYSSYILSYHPSAWTHPHPLSYCFINIFISFGFWCDLGFNKWDNQNSVLSDKQSLRLFSGVDFEHK